MQLSLFLVFRQVTSLHKGTDFQQRLTTENFLKTEQGKKEQQFNVFITAFPVLLSVLHYCRFASDITAAMLVMKNKSISLFNPNTAALSRGCIRSGGLFRSVMSFPATRGPFSGWYQEGVRNTREKRPRSVSRKIIISLITPRERY